MSEPCKKKRILIAGFLIFILMMVKAGIINPCLILASEPSEEVRLIYFYQEACIACKDIENNLMELYSYLPEQFGKKLNISMFNIAKAENYLLLTKYYDYYNVPSQKRETHVIFVGDSFLVGKDEIKRKLKEKVLMENASRTPVLYVAEKDEKRAEGLLDEIKWFNVFIAGLVNGFNPCALSMLLFFISALLSGKGRVRDLGLAYCTGKLITYFLLGTALYRVFSILVTGWYSVVLKVFLGVFIVVFTFMNFLDYLAARNEKYDAIRVQLPALLRRKNHEWINKIKSLRNMSLLLFFSFILGVVISVGEFLCAGQIYLATILYLLQGNQQMNSQAMIYFIIYNISFIFPQVALVFFIDKGKELFEISEVLRSKLPLIKLINSIIFLLLGIFLIFSLY